jgi:hypothetical protein
MDDDIFFDDSEIDHRLLERKLADNEAKKRDKYLWDKGYLDGLEWAETNYKVFDLANNQEML